MADNKVNFLRGTSAEYESKTKDNDTFYYTIDDEKLYLCDKEITSRGITIDNALSDTSENPVQNKVITDALKNKANNSHTHTKSEITDFTHTHDDRYYTESEINTKLNTKLNTSLKGDGIGIAELD